MKTLAALLAFTTLVMTQTVYAERPTTTAIEMAGIQVTFAPRETMGIIVDGVPFSTESTLVAGKPHYTGNHFRYEDIPRLVENLEVHRTSESVSARLEFRGRETTLSGYQLLEISTSRTLRLTVDMCLLDPVGGQLEHKIAGLPPGWIAGTTYTAVSLSGKEESGVVPPYPRTSGLGESTFICGPQVTFSSRMGPLTIRAQGEPIRVADYRRNRWSGPEPIFWCGILNRPLKAGERIKYTVEFQFPPKGSSPTSENQFVSSAPVVSVARALLDEEVSDRIIPTPKKLKWGEGVMPLDGAVKVDAPSPIPDLMADLGIDALLKSAMPGSGGSKTRVNVRLLPDGDKRIDAYAIHVTPNAARIEAPTTSGLVAAFNTLRQLVRYKDGRPHLRCCEIEDYASLPFRGIHLFSGRNARDLQIRFVRDILGALKINHIVYQCDYTKWESHPEIWHKTFGADKADVRAFLDAARKCQIQVTPLVNTFGHSEWLLENDAHVDLADNPDKPYAYDPSNPEVYRICEEIYDEAIDLFRPEFFHIGHDEITMESFPNREQNREKGATRLIMDDIQHYHRFLKKRGIRMMLWGDMFLAPEEASSAAFAHTVEEATRRREELPKDTFVCDWHYDPSRPEEFKSLGVLNRNGFDTVACTWDNPKNILNFAKAAAKEFQEGSNPGKTFGLLQTTWAGYSFDQKSLETFADQYAAYVLAAEAAWNGGAPDAESVPYDYRVEFSRLWNSGLLPASQSSGWTVDLSSVVNFRHDESFAHFGYSSVSNGLPSGNQTFGRIQFAFPEANGTAQQLLLAGGFNPKGNWPERVVLQVGKPASAIAFAVATTFGSAPASVARTVITLEDGSMSAVEWHPGQNVFSMDDRRITHNSSMLWESSPKDEMPRVIHGHIWKNPKPEIPIRSIEFRSHNRGNALLVFGITGITP